MTEAPLNCRGQTLDIVIPSQVSATNVGLAAVLPDLLRHRFQHVTPTGDQANFSTVPCKVHCHGPTDTAAGSCYDGDLSSEEARRPDFSLCNT